MLDWYGVIPDVKLNQVYLQLRDDFIVPRYTLSICARFSCRLRGLECGCTGDNDAHASGFVALAALAEHCAYHRAPITAPDPAAGCRRARGRVAGARLATRSTRATGGTCASTRPRRAACRSRSGRRRGRRRRVTSSSRTQWHASARASSHWRISGCTCRAAAATRRHRCGLPLAATGSRC